MDPLSISASIIGLSVAAVQVSHLLRDFVDSTGQAPKTARHVLMETISISVCLNQLDAFLSGKQETARSRRALIMIDQVIIIFTDCVAIFSELEQVLETLKVTSPMHTIDRMKWSFKEKTIIKLLNRLQGSKTSLNLLLTILTCTSLEEAEESRKDLATGIQLLLRSNFNISRRLRNIERMHPALAASSCHSEASSIFDCSLIQGDSRESEISFEKALESSHAYKRAGFGQVRRSTNVRSSVSPGPSFQSGLSLGDIENVSAIALPISSRELWNHHRYSSAQINDNEGKAQTLDAWYYPPPNRCAFIRTAYFNGQYTNQYTQPKFQGHLIYRRFKVDKPHSLPVFAEGAAILSSIEEESPHIDLHQPLANDVTEVQGSTTQDSGCASEGMAELSTHLSLKEELSQSFAAMDDAAKWRHSVLRMLGTIYC